MRVLFIGAHPDDPDYYSGGTARLYAADPHNEVRFVSMTNGDMGHHEMRGPALAERRRREAFMAGGVLGDHAEYVILNNRDGRLLPSLEARDEVIGLIRQFKPDIVFTHRPYDYHPDHRYTSMLVQDASYMLTVPGINPKFKHLTQTPMICYMEDDFQKPYAFQPDVAVAIDDVISVKIKMLACHVSQFFEWLPYNQGHLKEVPEDPEDRLAWLGELLRERCSRTADKYRSRLVDLYGAEKGEAVQYAEVFEACEYGKPLTDENRNQFFPFFG